MREIKFRVWDNCYKYMNYKVLVGIYGEWEKVKEDKNYTACAMWIEPDKVDYKCEPHWTCFEPYSKDIKLMQYTGRKDKSGKEIYEGDIFKIKYNKKDFMVWVEYSEKYAQFITRCEENILNDEPLGDLNEKHIEVIGNIYDNPELIKKD